MKITILFFLVILVSLFTASAIAEEITLNVGESQEVSGNNVKLKNLRIDKAVISVNDESQILNEGEEKNIGAMKVELKEIFYVSDNEGNAVIEVSALYVCGDLNCEGIETQANCCQDCGCAIGYDCEDNECSLHVEHLCSDDSECDDNNPDTSDRCTGHPRKCHNSNIAICSENSDCNDNNECTNDVCRNSDCFNELINGCANEDESEDDTNEEPGNDGEEQTDEELNNEDSSGEELSFFQKIINFFKNLF